MGSKTQINREIEIFSNGLIKFNLVIEKDRITSIRPNIGFHHKGIEKLCENQNCNQALNLISRIDSENPYIYPTAIAVAYERLNQIVVPEKVEYSRVLAIELLRIKNHLQMLYNLFRATKLSNFIDEVENKLITVETIINSLFLDKYLFIKIGGISYALADKTLDNLESFFDSLYDFSHQKKSEFEHSFLINKKLKNLGIISKEDAIYLSGINARASGVNIDLRFDRKLSMYNRFDFLRTLVHGGSCFDRARIRFDEIKQSIVIIKQAIRQMPIGDIAIQKDIDIIDGDGYVEVEGNSFCAGGYIEIKNKLINRIRVYTGAINILPLIEKIAIGLTIEEFNIFITSLHLSVTDIDK